MNEVLFNNYYNSCFHAEKQLAVADKAFSEEVLAVIDKVRNSLIRSVYTLRCCTSFATLSHPLSMFLSLYSLPYH